MRLATLTLAAALLAAPAAHALVVLDYPPPPGGYSGIRNYEVYSIRGVVRAEDINEFGSFQDFIQLALDFSTFVDGDGLLFVSVNGFGAVTGSAGIGAGIYTTLPALSSGPTAIGSYAGFDGVGPFGLLISAGVPVIGAPYEVNFSVNPLPAPALALLPGLVGLVWLKRRRHAG